VRSCSTLSADLLTSRLEHYLRCGSSIRMGRHDPPEAGLSTPTRRGSRAELQLEPQLEVEVALPIACGRPLTPGSKHPSPQSTTTGFRRA
jgi:hypothetical protein